MPGEVLERPCAAYQPVADLLGPGYLMKPPPIVGWRVRVIGKDGVVSQWDVDRDTAGLILNLCNRRADLRFLSAVAFDEQSAA